MALTKSKKGKSARKTTTQGADVNSLLTAMNTTGVTPTVKPTNTTNNGARLSRPTKKTSAVTSGGGGFGQGKAGLGGVSND